MAYRIVVRCLVTCMFFIGSASLIGCKAKTVKWTNQDYLSKFQCFIENNSVSNLVIVTHIKDDWCCLDDKHIVAVNYYRILYSFDDKIHAGDVVVGWSHDERDISKLWQLCVANGRRSEPRNGIAFVPFYDSSIICSKIETIIPDKANLCIQTIYYMRDSICPYPLEYILNDVDIGNVEIEIDKAMDAYYILQARYRNGKHKGAAK